MLSLLLSAAIASATITDSVPHDPERRIAAATERIRHNPGDPMLWVARARLQLATGATTAAANDLAAALRLDPGCVAALVGTAFAEHQLGNDVAALVAIRKAGDRGAAGPGLDRLRAQTLCELHRCAEAVPYFESALAATADPRPEHFLELAAALVVADGATASDRARTVLQHGMVVLGPVVALIDATVDLDVRAGECERALACLEQLRPFLARTGPLHERRAKVLEAAGRLAEAEHERRLGAHHAREPEILGAPAPAPREPRTASAVAPAAATLAPNVLVAAGAVWRYRDMATAPAVGWQGNGFDASAWPSGAAQLGYGDGDEATVIGSGPAGGHHPTSWFRHEFPVADASTLLSAQLSLLVDDGAVVYVNGTEVARWNLPTGTITSNTWALAATAGADENLWHAFPFAPSLLTTGTNVVAVEVHQVSATSSDVSMDLELVVDDGTVSIVRGPYLQNGTPSSAVVRWRTNVPTATQLWTGAAPTTLASTFFEAALRTDHTAVLSGLPAETLYHYRVGDAAGQLPGQNGTQTFRTLPAAGAVRPLRAWVLGDAGTGTAGQAAVRDHFATFAASRPADAILMLGDNAYASGTDAEYQVGVFDVYGEFLATTFCWSTLGNHDALSATTSTQTGVYYDVFDLPTAAQAGGVPSGTEAYYSFDRGHVHFVCLDSMDSDRTATGAMMSWLTTDLAATNGRWIVAYFHHPPYSFGSHNSDDPQDSGGRMQDMRQVALPILEAGGVDLVLCGHSHSYERSFLLDGHYGPSTSLQPGMVLDEGDGSDAGDGHYAKPTTGAAPHEGAVYVVAGSAGSLSGGPLNHPAMRVSLNALGSLVLDFDGDRLDASFVGLTGVEDQFTLVKGETRTLTRDQPRVSVAAAGRQDFHLAAGPAHAGRYYVLAGSFGTDPGFTLWGLYIPLNPDGWMDLTLQGANSPVYQDSVGQLDGNGAASAAFQLPPMTDPVLVGAVVHHAYVVFTTLGNGGLQMASNPVKLIFEP
jgi:tetratricopeptide (TPR) repeat protein